MRRFTPAILLIFAMPCCAADRPNGPAMTLDCSAADAYEFKLIYPFEVGDTGWYKAGDCRGGSWDSDAGCVYNPAVASDMKGNVPLERIPEGGRCGSQWAAYMESYGHSDWGSLFGNYDLGANVPPANGAGYEGISFWVRNPDRTGHAQTPTNKTIWFKVGDWRQVVAGNSTTSYPPPGDYRCVPPPNDNTAQSYDSNNQVSSTTRAPARNECGNYFMTRVETTSGWKLHLIPWSALYQDLTPNRNLDGIDPRDLRVLSLSIPVGATVELWVDDIAFYRRGGAGAGG